MPSSARPFDPARHIETADDVLTYLEAAMEGNDPKHIAAALGDVARSRGMTEIAAKSGLGRQALYNALSENGIRRWKHSPLCLMPWAYN